MIESFFGEGGGGYFSREEGKNRRGRRIERKMKVHGGKELVTESPIRVHASSFPRVLLFAPTRVGARIRIPRVCIYIHARPPPIPPVARPFPRACVCVRTRFSADEPATETRATIFEPGKERSRMNFLHNFGSPPRGF